MKRSWTIFLLVNLILSACAPASAPTPTIAPSAITLPTNITTTVGFESTATSTSEPTPTSTEVVLTPEQQLAEYLKNDEAKQSIDQFVNAMSSAGIEVMADQVNQGLIIQELKDKDGNPFLVATYNLDPDPTKQGETLEGLIPFAIAPKNNNGEWKWKKILLKQLGLDVGTLMVRYTYEANLIASKNIYDEFSTISLAYDLEWLNIEPQKGEHIFTQQPGNYHTNSELFVDFATKNGIKIMGG